MHVTDIASWLALDIIRREIGPAYGSEDLCVLLYSIVRRERPRRVLELGTGLGVTSAWIAYALKENGAGRLVTIDNGSQFATSAVQFIISRLSDSAKQAIPWVDGMTYEEFLNGVFEAASVKHFVDFRNADILLDALEASDLDMVFSDFRHAPSVCMDLLTYVLPRLSDNGSLFIDSASTDFASYLTLEHVVACINSGCIPAELRRHMSPPLVALFERKLLSSKLALTHLVENCERKQNSTAWLRWIPNGLSPYFGASMH